MAVFFTSDTHFGHKNIIKYSDRPFKDVTHMNEMLVYLWNQTVGPDDTVYHLGDVALGPIEGSLSYISRLNGSKVLITGNHDRNFHLGRRSAGLEPHEWDGKYLEAGFDAVYRSLVIPDVGPFAQVALSHFPYQGDSHDGDRYEQARREDDGTPLIHGHIHSHGDPITWTTKGTVQVHVGVDAWGYRPVSEHQIKELVGTRLT